MKRRKFGDLFTKCRFLEWIIKNNESKNYSLASEFLFSEEKRYADIVKITKSSTTAYEIKSEKDNTYRLYEQLNCYSKTFDYTYVVCHIKHLEAVYKIANLGIGIITETSPRRFKIIRKATKNLSLSPLSLLTLFSRVELQQFCNKKLDKTIPLEMLRKQLSPEINLANLKKYFRNTLFNRYKILTERFLREIEKDSIHPDDLLTLSRSANIEQSIW